MHDSCIMTLRWRHNELDGVSDHQPHGCLLNRLFRRRSKKTSKLRVTGLCVGNSPGPVNSPHKRPVTRNMFPFDDVIMKITELAIRDNTWLAMQPLNLFYLRPVSIKMCSLIMYRNFHYKNRTVVTTSYLDTENHYTWKLGISIKILCY